MSDQQNTPGETTSATEKQQKMQVGIKMQQGEQTGQPLYSNITTAQNGQGVVLLDFGYLDPQTIKGLNQKAQSGDQSQVVNAKLVGRMAISNEAAYNLMQQLHQMLSRQQGAPAAAQQPAQAQTQDVTHQTANPDNNAPAEIREEEKKFRFPWSSSDKNH